MSFIINNNSPIISQYSLYNKSLDFYATDSENNFLKSKKIKGENWYYNSTEIKYDFNEWGYRTKNFGDLNDDYILIFGCSFTEGIGLNYSDMWTTKLSKETGLDVFNMGMGGTGVDFQFYNTTLIHNYILNKTLNTLFSFLFFLPGLWCRRKSGHKFSWPYPKCQLWGVN